MEVHGPEVSFTPSEAHWIQVMGQYYPSMANLANRIYNARVAYACGKLDASGKMPNVVLDLPERGNTEAEEAYLRLLKMVQCIESQSALDPSGKELSVIKLAMDTAEKRALLARAQADPGITADNPELTEYYHTAGTTTIDQEWKGIGRMSHPVGLDEAFNLNAHFRNPTYLAESDEYQRGTDLGDMDEQTVMRGIVSALAADLGTTEQ